MTVFLLGFFDVLFNMRHLKNTENQKYCEPQKTNSLFVKLESLGGQCPRPGPYIALVYESFGLIYRPRELVGEVPNDKKISFLVNDIVFNK